MKLRCASFVLVLGLVLGGCATAPVEDIQPGEQPSPESDEAGLWMVTSEMEARLATSGRVIDDPALNQYLRDIVCKLAPDHCADIRLYIVRTPHFNASMAPNGFMQVWSGLLLRAQNEAQLAYIIGHELAHYLERHSVQQWRTVRDTSSGLVFFQIATGAAGVGGAGDIAGLIAIASIFAYSRDHEREADRVGVELMAKAGYDPREASKIWEAMIEEEEAAGDKKRSIWLATHPRTADRAETLTSLAADRSVNGNSFRGRTEYVAAIRPFRADFLRDELRSGSFATSAVVINKLIEAGDNRAETHFFKGELYRLRGEESDQAEAIKHYQLAVRSGPVPPEIHRALGLVYWRTGEAEQARVSFAEYLRLVPGASDRLMIQSYLDQLE